MLLRKDKVTKDITNPNEISDYMRMGWKVVETKTVDDKIRSQLKS